LLYFQGYDSITGAGRSTAVKGKTDSSDAESFALYQTCLDINKLAQTLSISQSLSVGLDSIGSLDEKIQFMRSLSLTTYSLSIVVYARQIVGTDTATKYSLDVAYPHGPKSIRDFVRSHGDSFISSITKGGEYYAIYTFYCEDKKEKESLVGDLKAHGLYDGVTLDANLQANLDTFRSSKKILQAVMQKILDTNVATPDEKGIVEFALKFTQLKLSAPEIINFQSSGYEHVPNFPSFLSIPDTRNDFIGTELKGGLKASVTTLLQMKNQIAWLQSIYEAYGFLGDTKLSDASAQVQSDIAKVDQQVRAWESDPTHAFTLPEFESLKLGTPSLSCKIDYSHAYGNEKGGKPFMDIDPASYVQKRTKLTKIQLGTGDHNGTIVLSSLRVEYSSIEDVKNFRHGEAGGVLSQPLSLLSNEYIMTISGQSGDAVDHLTVTKTGGQNIEAGGDGGKPFSWPVPGGSFVLGFAGREGDAIDQIQLVYATLSPATWNAPIN
jgi:hypothetical protein